MNEKTRNESSENVDDVPINGKRKLKRKAPVVLEDDEYLERMGRIIRRDFYPDLHEIYKKEENSQGLEEQKVDDISLEKFQRKFSSEDNESFKELHKLDKEKHRKRYWWAFENDISDKRLLKSGMEGQKRLEDKKRTHKSKSMGNLKNTDYSATRFSASPRTFSETASVTSGVTQQSEPLVPMVNGYAFVTTPRINSRPESVASQFSVAKRSSREEAAYKLSRIIEKGKGKVKSEGQITEGERQKQNRIASVKLSISGSKSSRKRILTPAAQSLASRLAK
uniref:Uncharacterized protein n=1 Tax=Aplanochytrium stocchinoi TaxID=215587 RepID=A0A7S3LG83_9STRA|mmetsp:Transcript_19789/g.23996  ORF Transcript_19789/g.23996 Transcript_19789/m.23996 type:complete len:280 (+) Transcript_19789:210-1049(+)|eukprot:CAMPEP_0204838716 /NCGR_PEP_ID=MMETSP1346-20131115/31663_1 /ASSEMBLY_ACC=CAM_ASM_000771 /TAXON_ID=215587 /ORGANISM="Aplanochytrium stocchinoi, Strain GSBS06" /LENGTH=279 /DNA_ID=CAMNT_0051974923 /DNA_START=178 /DNA_END=1017 /DNA_ORIENTATION=-